MPKPPPPSKPSMPPPTVRKEMPGMGALAVFAWVPVIFAAVYFYLKYCH